MNHLLTIWIRNSSHTWLLYWLPTCLICREVKLLVCPECFLRPSPTSYLLGLLQQASYLLGLYATGIQDICPPFQSLLVYPLPLILLLIIQTWYHSFALIPQKFLNTCKVKSKFYSPCTTLSSNQTKRPAVLWIY